MTMSDTNPLFDALLSNNTDHDAKRREAREEHSLIMDAISDRENVDTSTLSGRTYFDPTIQGFQDYDFSDDFDEAAEADWNLSVRDMPVGLLGAKNRKRPLDIARATLGMATALDSVENRHVLDNITTRANQDFTGSGWSQAGRSAWGAVNVFQDVTADTTNLLNEVRSAVGTAQLKDDKGEPMEFTPEAYLAAVTKHNPEVGIALKRYGINAESMKGIDNVGTATEELAKKLWYAGQEERSATSNIPNGFFTLRGLNNLGNTLGQDPDLAGELAIEVGGTIITGGAYAAAKLATKASMMIARRSGGAAAKAAARATARGASDAVAARYGRMAARADVRLAESISNGMMRVAGIVETVNVFKPGLSFGGNVAEWAAKRGKVSGWVGQNSAFAVGQLADGLVGGAGARLRSNMFLQDEAMNAYGDLQGVNLTDNMAMEGAMGAGFSLILGSTFRYGGRAFLNQFRTNSRTLGYDDYTTENVRKARSEQETLEAIYGEDVPAGVKAWQAQRNATNDAMMQLAFLGGEDVTLTGVTKFIGNLPSGISKIELNLALQRLTRNNVGFLQDGKSLDERAIAAALLGDKEFVKALESNKALTPEEVRTQAKLRRAQILDGTEEDLEMKALLSEGKSEADAIAELKAQRKAEIEAERQAAAKELEDAKADAQRRKDAGKEVRDAEKATRDAEAKELEAAQRAADDANADAARARDELEVLVDPDGRAARAEAERASFFDEAPKGPVKDEDLLKRRKALADEAKKTDDPAKKQELNDKADEIEDVLTRPEVAEPAARTPEAIEAKKAEVADAGKKADEADAKARETREGQSKARNERDKISRDTDETVDAEMNKRQEQHDRKQEALTLWDKDIDDGKHGGAGGGNKTELVHLKAIKKVSADEAKAEIDVDMEDLLKRLDDGETISGAELHRRGIADEDTPADKMFGKSEIEAMAQRRKDEIDKKVSVITDGDISVLSRIMNDDELAAAELRQEAQSADDLATHKAMTTRASGDIIDDPSKFRAPRVRTEAEAKAATAKRRGSAGKYNRDADLAAARVAEGRLASLLERASTGVARRGDGSLDAQAKETGTASYDAIHSAFKGTDLEDIDLEYAFGEAVVSGTKSDDMLFDVQRVQDLLQQRIDAIDKMDVDPDSKLTPQQIRQRQANEVAKWRQSQAERAARRHEEATGSKFRGAKNADDYEASVIAELTKIMRTRKSKALNTTNEKTVREGIASAIAPFVSPEFKVSDLGDGTLDHVHPTVAARAMADMLSNNTNGTQRHKAEVVVRNEETGLDEVKVDNTDQARWVSGIQPGTDREIAMVLQRMEYDYRMEAIAKHDFSNSDSVSIDEVLDFIEGQEMRQDQGRAMNREELALRALWTPPQLRTNLVNGKPETLAQRITRVQNELLDMDATAYDALHDEFNARPGEFGVGQIAPGTENGNWFAAHGVAGGFPLATVMPDADGNYSFGQAVLDAHTLIHPQTMNETIAAMTRGNKQFARLQELKKKGKKRTKAEQKEFLNLRHDKALRSLDGAQNGVRHAHALAMLDNEDSILSSYDLVSKGTGQQRDFYNDLATASQRRFLRQAEAGDAMAKFWAESGAFRFQEDGVTPAKASRKFAKKPVMILPYGAGKKAIRGAVESHLNSADGASIVKSMEAKGISRKEAVDYLSEQWYGNNKKDARESVDSLIREALELPEAEQMMDIISRDIARKDPLQQIVKEKDPAKAAKLMIEEAQRLAKNNEYLDEDAALRAIQLEARARAATQSDNLTKEQVKERRALVRSQWMTEVNLLQSGNKAEIERMAGEGKFTFFEASLNALFRSQFHLADTAQARNSKAMTGQANADFGLPVEAEGNMYFNQLVDWRTRMVTPTTREADLKGRKSRRGMLDIKAVVEEAEFVKFRTDEEAALADIRNVGEEVDGKVFTEDDWFAKHIDETVGSGVVTYRTHKGSLKKRLRTRADSLSGEKLRAKARELDIPKRSSMKADELRTAIYDRMVEAEQERIARLTVKAALAEAAPEFSPPLARGEDGSAKQLDRLSEDQKLDRWEMYSDDVRQSSAEAQARYSELDESGKAAYEKSYGKPHQSYLDEDGSSNVGKREMSDNDFDKLPDAEKKQTPRTMGGMLGSRPIHPTESTDMMLGVPALRAAAQRRSGGKVASEGKDSITAAERKAGQREMIQPHALKRINEGGDLFNARERNRVTHTTSGLLADVSLSEEHIFGKMSSRYSPEVQDQMIERMLGDHAKRFGLEKELEAGDWGAIYAHRVWSKNVKQLKGDLDRVSEMEPLVDKRTGEVESHEDFMQRRFQAVSAFHEKWRKIAQEDLQKWEDATNKQWDAHDIDPFGNIKEVSAFSDDGKHLTWREAIADSATRDGRGGRIDEGRARRQTNIDAVTTESVDGLRFTGDDSHLPGHIQWRRDGASPTLPFERAGGPTEAPRSGFARTMVEDFESGQKVDMDSLDENQVLQVHYVHAMDRTAATGSVGMHIGASLIGGMHRIEPWTVGELRRAIAAGEINGASGNVRFTINDVEVVDGHMVGHNVRRSNSRNQNFHILQNSQNRYLGDRLGVSALTQRPVRKQPSVWSRMDDRARQTRHETSGLMNESKGMLRFLADRDSKSVDQSSFLGNLLDVGQYWNDPEWRGKFLRSHLLETEARSRDTLGVSVKEIANELNINERGNLNKSISGNRNPEGLTAQQIRVLTRAQTRTNGTGKVQGAESGSGDFHPMAQEFFDTVRPENGRFYSKRQVRQLINELDMESERFDPTIDPRETPEMKRLVQGDLMRLAEEVAGAQLVIGGRNLLNDTTLELLVPDAKVRIGAIEGGDIDLVLAAANSIVEHNRSLRKLQKLATWDGITGLGWTDVALRAYSEGKIDLDNPSDADLKEVYSYWARHEYGSGSRSEDVSKMSEGDKALARRAIAEAKRVTDHETPDPFSDGGSPTWKGSFVDQTGTKREPAYFMDEKNFVLLSEGHRQFNSFLNSLLVKGSDGNSTLTLPEVRMLRAAAAQMDGDIFDGLDMAQVGDLLPMAKELGLPDPSSVRARGMAYNTKGQMGLRVLRNQLGRDLNAVDVILHEVGHVAQRRLMAEGSPELRAARSLATNPEGKKAMRDMVTTMHGGKFTTDARKAYDYYTTKGNEDEFLAAWFSYTMMSRSLDDRATINAAYRKAGGIGELIARAIDKIASYAYRRVGQMARIMGRMDGAYRAQMDSLMDAFTGKTEMPRVDRPDEFASYHADGGEASHSSPDSWLDYIDELRRHGMREDDPEMLDAKAAYDDAVQAALDNAKPRDFDPEFPGSESLRDYHAERVAEDFTDDAGVVDFGRMVQEDWQAAEQWMAIHFLPILQEGRYAEIPQIKEEAAVKRQLSSDAKAGVLSRTYWDNRILQQARAEHTVNSKVQLQVGDAQYSIMQLLSELIDNHTILTNGRINGRPFLSLTSVAKALESDIIRPMAILDDELRMVVAKSAGSVRSRVSRAMAEKDAKVQPRLQHLRRLAGSLALPKETNQYKAAVAEMKKLKAESPEEFRVTQQMADLHVQSAQRVKRDAVATALVGSQRAEDSGDMPLRLRREHMTNKAVAGGYGEVVSDIYSRAMSADLNNIDVDTLVGKGILPDPTKVRTGSDLRAALETGIEAGHLDKAYIDKLHRSGSLDTLVRIMKSGRPEVLRKGFAGMLTPEGRKVYDDGVQNGNWTAEGREHISRRFEDEIRKTESAASKVVYQKNSSGAELRALRLGRKVGSTSYFFGGDDFVSMPKLIDEAVDSDGVSMFETDVRVGASALVRGIGLEAADSANLAKAFGENVRGFSTKRLMQLLKKSSLRTDDATKTSMEHGLRHLERAYEKLSGGLPTIDTTGGVINDGLARSATDFAMLTYGGNLGVAMLAETTATAINDIAPRFFSTPVKTMGMVWKSMTEGVSPIRKTQIARQLLFGMHVARDTVSARSMIRDTVDDLNPSDDLVWFQRWLKVGGSMTSKASLAPTVQTFNKGFAAAGAMDDVLTYAGAARNLRKLMDDRDGVASKKEFRELAKEAGFGRQWTLALRMQDAGMLEPKVLDSIEAEAKTQGADVSRILDMDVMSRNPANADATTAMRVFVEEAVAKNNVEPRVLDMRLVDNSGWNKVMDVFLAWPRAFYAQKSFARGGNAFSGGFGHVAGFYLGQAMWDSMYTTLQELARGEDPDKILHEVENDPAGWFAKKVTRMPVLGAWGSVLADMAVDGARNRAAQMGVEGFGYHTRSMGGLDFGSSPVGSAMNGIATAMQSTVGYVNGLTNSTATFSLDDQQAVQSMGQWSKLMPLLNSLPAQVIKSMLAPNNPRDALKTEMYYEVLQMKRQIAHRRKQMLANLR